MTTNSFQQVRRKRTALVFYPTPIMRQAPQIHLVILMTISLSQKSPKSDIGFLGGFHLS